MGEMGLRSLRKPVLFDASVNQTPTKDNDLQIPLASIDVSCNPMMRTLKAVYPHFTEDCTKKDGANAFPSLKFKFKS